MCASTAEYDQGSQSGSQASLIKMFSSPHQLILTTQPTFVSPPLQFSPASLEKVLSSHPFTSQLVELEAAALPFLMQMCANRQHCSSAWFSVSVTPLCSGLSLVPRREMFPFKCYLSVSFKTSSFLLTNSPEEWSEPAHWASFSGTGRKRERDVLQPPPSDIPAHVLFFFPPLGGWVIL